MSNNATLHLVMGEYSSVGLSKRQMSTTQVLTKSMMQDGFVICEAAIDYLVLLCLVTAVVDEIF